MKIEQTWKHIKLFPTFSLRFSLFVQLKSEWCATGLDAAPKSEQQSLRQFTTTTRWDETLSDRLMIFALC